MAATLVHLQEVERLSSRVIRILGGNPSKFTLQGTNTYLIGQGPSRVLLDTGEGKPSWTNALKSVLASENASISTALLTHWHHDHVDGIPALLGLSPDTQIYKSQISPSKFPNQHDIRHGQVFRTQGATLRACHTPGHTIDHMAFVLEEERAMFTGDNVLGQGTAVFEDLPTYLSSLEAMEREFDGRAYPGHGPVLEDGRAKVREYIRHRAEREEQVLEVLRGRAEDGGGTGGGDGEEGWETMQIVRVVYKGYPENLHLPAKGGVLQVLDKMEKEGKVVRGQGERWRLASKAAL